MLSRNQLPLALKKDPAFDEGQLFISAHNQAAMDWINLWPKWNALGLIIYGPKGCGKSQLGKVWQHRASASAHTPQDILEDSIHGLLQKFPNILLTIDDYDTSFETRLFHLYNIIKEVSGNLLILARTPPIQWGITLPDLRSRLCALPAVEITHPDDDAITLLLIKLFNDRQLRLTPATMTYIIQRAPRSFENIQKLVDLIDQLSLELHRDITIPLVRQAIELLSIGDS